MSSKITESQFYMWRTLFALTHVDNVVTSEETKFMVEALEGVPFTPEQHRTLTEDIGEAQDTIEMYSKISDPKAQAEFFKFAREVVWVDGHYSQEERDIMLKLKEIHVRSVNVDDLIGTIDLKLEDGFSLAGRDTKKTIFSFRDSFLKDRFNV